MNLVLDKIFSDFNIVSDVNCYLNARQGVSKRLHGVSANSLKLLTNFSDNTKMLVRSL